MAIKDFLRTRRNNLFAKSAVLILLVFFSIYPEAGLEVPVKSAERKAQEEQKRNQQLIPFSFGDRALADIINSLNKIQR